MRLELRKRGSSVARDDRKLLGRSEDPDIAVASADGLRLRDERGRTFLDFTSGWCVSNLGYNHPEILGRLRRFNGPSYVSPSHLYAPWVELARELAELCPGDLERVYRAVGGTEAVEIAIQLAIRYTGREHVVALEGAYHGNSIAALAVGSGGPLELRPKTRHLALPLDVHAVSRLETLLHHRDVAAVIMEPIAINLGVAIPDADFMTGIAAACRRHGTLLIFDEVACGFGRTGTLFASEHYHVVPDIQAMAKSITAGHAPLGATITTRDIGDAVRDDFEFYSTFAWHPFATEAALATLDYFRRHRDTLFANVAARSDDIRRRLEMMVWKHPPEIRVSGLALAVDTGDADYARRIANTCRDTGLLLDVDDETLLMFPALTLDEPTVHEAMDLLEQALG
jgi:acetylornithine/N-succinyldiaminopimelate aminotransferase